MIIMSASIIHCSTTWPCGLFSNHSETTQYVTGICNRHIMLDLPTIKTDFLFENSQDFNQTTHARPQHPIVFIHNISLYFNCISSVKYVFKWSCHGHIMPFSVV